MSRIDVLNQIRWLHTDLSYLPTKSPMSARFITRVPLRNHTRPLNRRSPLHRLARPSDRPQLPFLHQTSTTTLSPSSLASALPATNSKVNHVVKSLLQRNRPGGNGAGGIGGRFISTERKARWKARLLWQLRFHAYFWPIAILSVLIAAGVQQTKMESEHPTPREWSFWSRWYLRTAKHTELDDEAKVARILTDWAKAGYYYKQLVERLEDSKGKDGINVVFDAKSDRLVDVSVKSAQWRNGYYEALIGAARTAEHLDGLCKRKDEERGRLYPWESIPGPSNPRPKPLPWDRHGTHQNVPTEEQVEDAFARPEYFYNTILNGKGFNTRQRIDAALAYADWCEFKGQNDLASEMIRSSLSIAAEGIKQETGRVVDLNTGIIYKGKEKLVSENVLKSTTALAVHYARKGDVKKALPILLSVLRTQKLLQVNLIDPTGTKNPVKSKDTGLWPYVYAFKNLIIEQPYPQLPSAGNEKPNPGIDEACEEMAIMTYIGEILFASSEKEREKGLSWTRDCVEAAEATLWVLDEQKLEAGKERCRQCLETGLLNWKTMATQMTRLAFQKAVDAEKGNGWLGTGLGKTEKVRKAQEDVKRWEEEEVQVELRRQKTLPLLQPLKPAATSWMSV